MELISTSLPENPASNEKSIRIDQLVHKHQAALEEWASNPDHHQRLDFPPAVMQALIPRKIYEIAENPDMVAIVSPKETHKSFFNGFIKERRENPVSNPESLSMWLEAVKKKKEDEKEQAEKEGKKYRFRTPPAPEDVDEVHWLHYKLLLEGSVTAYDYIMTNMILYGDDLPDVLHVGTYDDRYELHGKGIGISFYTNLHDVARKIGYRYITGSNNERNVGFFTNKLGRYTLSQIKPEFRGKFHYDPHTAKLQTNTVDFLYDEDKALYVVQE